MTADLLICAIICAAIVTWELWLRTRAALHQRHRQQVADDVARRFRLALADAETDMMVECRAVVGSCTRRLAEAAREYAAAARWCDGCRAYHAPLLERLQLDVAACALGEAIRHWYERGIGAELCEDAGPLGTLAEVARTYEAMARDEAEADAEADAVIEAWQRLTIAAVTFGRIGPMVEAK